MKKTLIVFCFSLALLANTKELELNIENLITMISNDFKINFVLDKDIKTDIKLIVSKEINKDDLFSIFNNYLSQNNLQLVKKNNIYFITMAKDDSKKYVYLHDLQAINKKDLNTLFSVFPNTDFKILELSKKLLIHSNRTNYNRIKEYLDLVNFKSSSRAVKITILETSENELKERGINYNYQFINKSDTFNHLSNIVLGSYSTVSSTSEKSTLSTLIKFLDSENISNVKQSPVIYLLDGEKSSFKSTKKIKIEKSKIETLGETPKNTISYEYTDIGTSISIEPKIFTDYIDLKLDISITDVFNLNNRVILENNQSIILAGILREETIRETSGVPVLKDTPFIRHLFSTTSKNISKTKITIIIETLPSSMNKTELEPLKSLAIDLNSSSVLSPTDKAEASEQVIKNRNSRVTSLFSSILEVRQNRRKKSAEG